MGRIRHIAATLTHVTWHVTRHVTWCHVTWSAVSIDVCETMSRDTGNHTQLLCIPLTLYFLDAALQSWWILTPTDNGTCRALRHVHSTRHPPTLLRVQCGNVEWTVARRSRCFARQERFYIAIHVQFAPRSYWRRHCSFSRDACPVNKHVEYIYLAPFSPMIQGAQVQRALTSTLFRVFMSM